MPKPSQRDFREWKTDRFQVDDALGVKPPKLAEGDWGSREETWILGELIIIFHHKVLLLLIVLFCQPFWIKALKYTGIIYIIA